MSDLDAAVTYYWSLVHRYNREWVTGRWDTNRTLASAIENAYNDAINLGWDGRS